MLSLLCMTMCAYASRSQGATVSFPVVGGDNEQLTVYTTRAETLFGVTFLAASFEHPCFQKDTTVLEQLDHDCSVLGKVSRSNISVTHPVTGNVLPVLAADYVLAEHGSGAVIGQAVAYIALQIPDTCRGACT